MSRHCSDTKSRHSVKAQKLHRQLREEVKADKLISIIGNLYETEVVLNKIDRKRAASMLFRTQAEQ